MINTAISDNPSIHFPGMPKTGILASVLIAVLLHTSLIWLFNRHASYDDTAHHINNSTQATGLSITMVSASSWASEPEAVPPPPPLLSVPESPTKPEIALDKAVPSETKVEKQQESNKPKKRKKPQEMPEKKLSPSPQVQENSHTEQEINGSDQINSQGNMSRATTSQPLVGQGNSEVDNYNARLRQEIERHKKYPRKAKRMKQQGIVTVTFTLLNDGTLAAARIVNSSGSSTLDNAALDAINNANSVGTKPADIAPEVTLLLEFMLNKAD
ncbi:TonB-like protein [Xenorhabdus mauleonii]|uniref:Outer membrane transport energization protein TonB n=1 Tax=Xenorhabdus mauleonii TaxID=351675 RepID=A0A1I3UNU4_9GAMM|nr:energy transducer TonB [Xenorhabdus mauleonii]PHM39651.1 TonB-like protein [Xenorhabdus mauleonii]SFJ83616.1 outer membrane transport energization protein TonB [Xenorhabdus mauleonii]